MNNNIHNEEHLKIKKDKKLVDKLLLKLEIFILLLAIIILLLVELIFIFSNIDYWFKVCIFIFGFIIFLSGALISIKIEQVSGYYECQKCFNKYIPTYKSVLISPHIGRKRMMKCPKCGQKSWNKKII